MNDSSRMPPILNETTPESDQPTPTGHPVDLEQQMADLGLSNDTRRFLRDLHHAEMQLNYAYDKAHQGGALEKRVSQVYHDLYGSEETSPASR